MTETDDEIGDAGGHVVASEHPSDMLLVGDESAVAEFVARWASAGEVTVRTVGLPEPTGYTSRTGSVTSAAGSVRS